MTLIRPMLAKTYGDGPSCQYKEGMLVQPKLNGIRALYQNGTMISRREETFHHLTHIKNALESIPTDVILDGELYLHGLPLQQINSRCAVTRVTPHTLENSVEFHIFDYISEEPCAIRMLKLSRLFREAGPIKVVDTFLTLSEKAACSHYLQFLSSGYEGMMYRDPTAPYGIPNVNHKRQDNRVAWLLKRKEWLDAETIILGMTTGEGKHADTMSSFVLLWDGHEFEVSSGPSDLERKEYIRLGPLLKGKVCRIEYRELTDAGIPRHARIVQVELPKESNL